MAKLKIYTFPDTVLSQKASPVARVEKSYRRLADDMLETMYEAPGIGLAANQVGLLERIVVVDTDFDVQEVADGIDEMPTGAEVTSGGVITNKNPRILINPEILYREGKILFSEGCLSVPEYTAEVERAEKIKLQYLDIDGLTKTLDADGLLAVCIQHELDHLDGKLFIDRLSPLKKKMVKKKLLAERQEREARGDLGPGSDLHDLGGPRKKGL
ncbi:MAG: peptide deformylase [Bdellovibrionales bacterium]|nr:peptide deformylase [Bdellovibrionales bacterium]